MGKTFGSFPIFSYLCTEKRKQYNNKKKNKELWQKRR